MSLSKIKEIRQPLVNELVEALKNDQIPWHKPWNSVGSFGAIPYNGITNRKYNGINRFHLMMENMVHGYTDPRWMTFNQAKEAGYKIMKKPDNWMGAYGVHLECWKLYNTETKKIMNFSDYAKLSKEEKKELDKKLQWRNYPFTVFNGSRIEGLQPLEKVELRYPKSERVEKIFTELAENLKLPIHYGFAQAFYKPSEDVVYMPYKEDFYSMEGYASILLHEMSHATGHESRLNRDTIHDFGRTEYAREELRAEISSMFLCQDLEMTMNQEHLDNHKAYVQSWISVLENDPDELFKAIKDAEKINDYLMKYGKLEQLLKYDVNGELQEVIEELNRELEGFDELQPIRM